MNIVISWILAIFALIGGLDYLFGDKLKLGNKFEKAFSLMGPMALSITGIVVMVPILSFALQKTIVPLFTLIGFDPVYSAVSSPSTGAVFSLPKTWQKIPCSASTEASR